MDDRVRDIAPPNLQTLFDMVVDLEPRLDFGAGPVGRRVLFGSAGGTFTGARVGGHVLPGGGDWTLFRSNGVMTLDVRLSLKMEDGSLVFMTYGGRWRTPDDAKTEMADAATRHLVDPSRYYFRTNPLFETGAPDYAWMNDIVCVGVGYLVERGIGYRVFEVL